MSQGEDVQQIEVIDSTSKFFINEDRFNNNNNKTISTAEEYDAIVSPNFDNNNDDVSPSVCTEKNVKDIYPKPVPTSFINCVICNNTPTAPPLYGCEHGHLLCRECRNVCGNSLSCPKCGSFDLGHRLSIAEELLADEKQKNCLVFCPFKAEGCCTVTRRHAMELHKAYCLFKPVRCPKAMFSLSCNHTGPVCTIQQHGRDKHNLHYGVTDLELGVISSKMFDISADKTCCEDIRNAKYQPLELLHNESLFYCYFERVADRGVWFFFIRMYASKEQASKFKAGIMIGSGGLDRNSMESAVLRYTGKVAHYDMRRDEIRSRGMVLSVADEVMMSCKVGNVLFRVWFKVELLPEE